MLEIWREIWCLIDSQSRKQYAALIVFAAFSSLIQAVGVSSVPAFFAVLIDGQLPQFVRGVFQHWSILELGMVVFTILVSGSLMSALATFLGVKIAWNQYPRVSTRVLRQLLNNRYEWHIGQNSNELGKIVLDETYCVVLLVLQQFVLLLVKGCELLFISLLLFLVKPWVAVASAGSFFAVYFLLYSLNRKFIYRQGEITVKANTERHRASKEALSAIKTVKSFECEEYFVERFKKSASAFSQATSNIQYFSLLPKYFMEVTIFGGLVGFVVVSELRNWAIYESIPLITMYGAAAVRLLPAVQQCYYSAISINGAWPSLKTVVTALADLSRQERQTNFTEDRSEDVLRLENVSYTYPGTEEPSLHNINLSVRKGDKIGVVGITGAGKTTMVDLLLGLLPPAQGRILIKTVPTTCRADYVGYVPQTVSFIDGTIAENIALGQSATERDLTSLTDAATAARIHDHIVTLPLSYDTPIGEAGVRLSGGQRQRIGIARALYRRPELLVLDEASSALDANTEQELFSSLLQNDLTLIVIAHRLSILKSCSKILLLSNGRIVAQGTYEQLLECSPLFAKLAQSQSEAHWPSPDSLTEAT